MFNSISTQLPVALRVYAQPRVLIILLLGFSAGMPLALSGSTLTIWMAERGVDLSAIGLFALAGLPYSIKFLWAPIVDALHVPFLSARFGRRRGWLIFSQLLLMGAIVYLGSLDPLNAPFLVALGAVVVATASATQDIVIDAFRVESLEPDEQAAGMAYYVSAYRVAMLVSTAGVIVLVAFLEEQGVAAELVWFYGYVVAALFILVGVGAVLLADEPQARAPRDKAATENSAPATSPFQRLYATSRDAFVEFFKTPLVVPVLIFIVLFKFCDALAGVMTGPFVLDIGFDKTTYATVVKGVGLAAALTGGFVGGALARSMDMGRALLLGGILQMGSNLMFLVQAVVGAEYWLLVGTIIIENFTGAIGTVIFVAYLSGLCGATRHTATQFALLTALAAVGRTTLSASSGFLASLYGWPLFFVLTVVAAVPGLLLLLYLERAGHFRIFSENR